MDDKIIDILNKLSDGKTDVEKAIKDINNINYTKIEQLVPIKNAKKIKIYINAIDNEEGKNIKINIPALSLKFIKRIGTFAIKVALKHSNEDKSYTKYMNNDCIKHITDALSLMPPFEIVNIDSTDAKIHIYTI